MKIGILTLPLQQNYGGILQCWALQHKLIQLGHSPELIARYHRLGTQGRKVQLAEAIASFNTSLERNKILKNLNFINSLLEKIYNHLRLHYIKFADNDFVKKISKSPVSFEDFELRNQIFKGGYEAFIVGSDQVWREEYSPRIMTYFLDFLNPDDARPKIAYAASFGVSSGYISQKNMAECERLIKLFDKVSVREDSGVEIVRNDFGRRQVDKVLDPTLLLEQSEYQNLIRRKDHHTYPYAAAYVLDDDNEKSEIVKSVANHKGLKIERINLEDKNGSMPSISQWLALFADSEFVVTDSFHGCVFSIIFNKPFIAIANKRRGLERFYSLLNETGLEDRLVFSYREFTERKDLLLSGITYNDINCRLENLRQFSISWLMDSINKR